MKKKSLLLSVIMFFSVAMFLSACAEDEGVVLLTGGTGGTYYPLGGEMATIIKDETGIETDSRSSNASADNVIDLHEGEAEVAMVQTDVMSFAAEGIHNFEDQQVDNVQAMGSLYPETIQIVTTEDAGINSVEDLADKAVSVGAPGSGTYINAEQILEVHGMTIDDINAHDLAFDESTDGIQDGNIDAAFITAGTPTGSVDGLGAQVDIDIVPIEDDKIADLIDKYPYYAEDTIESDVYNLDGDVQTVAVLAMLAVTEDLDEDTTYEITKAIYDNTDEITHGKGELITKESALDGIDEDLLHPGAKKYFEEEGLLD